MMEKDKTLGRCPKPRKLFEKSLTRRPSGENFIKNRALRGSGAWDVYILVVLVVIAFFLIGRAVSDRDLPIGSQALSASYGADLAVVAFMSLDEPAELYDSGDLWLVNRDNMLPSGFTPSYIVTHQGIQLHLAAQVAYGGMLIAMQDEIGGIHGLQLVSGYRPYEYQRGLFDKKVRELMSQGHSEADAVELASESVQQPGASEHQTGLALDVTTTGRLTPDFAVTTAGQWLADNSHRFGFIIRYPQHKTEVTQIIYEPWHLRYIGIPHAHIIWENGITLEEYAAFIASAPYILWQDSRNYFLVVYTEFWPAMPPQGLYGISSTRAGGGGGYIVTFNRAMPE